MTFHGIFTVKIDHSDGPATYELCAILCLLSFLGQMFSGNFDQETDVKNYFPAVELCRAIRIKPMKWKGEFPALRMEVLGLPGNNKNNNNNNNNNNDGVFIKR